MAAFALEPQATTLGKWKPALPRWRCGPRRRPGSGRNGEAGVLRLSPASFRLEGGALGPPVWGPLHGSPPGVQVPETPTSPRPGRDPGVVSRKGPPRLHVGGVGGARRVVAQRRSWVAWAGTCWMSSRSWPWAEGICFMEGSLNGATLINRMVAPIEMLTSLKEARSSHRPPSLHLGKGAECCLFLKSIKE